MNIIIKNKITDLMLKDNLPPLSIEVFLAQYARLAAGENSFISENEIQPVNKVADMTALPDYSSTGKALLNQSVTIKLNGGLGTGMGLQKAKSLLLAKNKLSFLEIIIKQVIFQRKAFNCELPIIFMNSFSTEADTHTLLNKFPELQQGQKAIPLSFLQNKVPKIQKGNLQPANWSKDPDKIWCPPGHGDIYTSLQTSGTLEKLLKAGIKYAFISNSDNLGASLDPSLLGYFSEQDASFMMEIADRTIADKKGGHLAQNYAGDLLLRESAQCHDDDKENFQDTRKYRYFNTNNLWIRLDRLKHYLDGNQNMLDLPLIHNNKNLDPRDPNSPQVIQIETAMGSAISCFKDSIALRIPKSRFIPIKTTNELLALWSNAFILDQNYLVTTNSQRKLDYMIVNLDSRYYKNIDDLLTHFPEGAPDLLDCQKLTILGDVKFGNNVKLIGNISIVNDTNKQILIESDSLLQGT